jgi:hypothetical protein
VQEVRARPEAALAHKNSYRVNAQRLETYGTFRLPFRDRLATQALEEAWLATSIICWKRDGLETCPHDTVIVRAMPFSLFP